MSFFKFHKNMFKELEPTEFLVYCGVLSYANRLGSAYCKISTLAKRCAISERSVCRATKSLESKGMITITKRYARFDRRRSNLYTVTVPSKDYCKIDRRVFALELTPTAFKLYVYLLRQVNRNNVAFPSLKKMAKELGLSIDTIVDKTDYLIATGVIDKITRIKKGTRSFGVNNYIMLLDHSQECIDLYVDKVRSVWNNTVIKVLRTFFTFGAVIQNDVELLHQLKFRPKHTLLAAI